jgi:hypothetical protein
MGARQAEPGSEHGDVHSTQDMSRCSGEEAERDSQERARRATDLFWLFLGTVPTARDAWSLPWDEIAERERAARQIAESMGNHLRDH